MYSGIDAKNWIAGVTPIDQPASRRFAIHAPGHDFAFTDAIAVITFDRDDKANAFNTDMTVEVNAAIDAALAAGARVIVLRQSGGGSGARARSGRIASGRRPRRRSHAQALRKDHGGAGARDQHGRRAVYGGGLMLNMVSDIVIASTTAMAAMTANKFGHPPCRRRPTPTGCA